MKKPILIAAVLVIALSGGAVFYFYSRSQTTPTPAAPPIPEKFTPIQNNDIIIEDPLPGATVASPLTVRGSARGTWFFEASFPVILENRSGKVLAQTPAQTMENWMTADFIPFSATLVFDTANDFIGTLIFKKDNPSGLPQYDKEVRVPVKFR
jgi:hypothetical protein